MLDSADARDAVAQRLLGVGERQQVVVVAAVERGPAQVFGDEAGFEAVDQASQCAQVRKIQRIGGAQPQPDTMHGQRIALADLFEQPQLRPAIGEEVLGVDFEPRDGGMLVDDARVVLRAQPDPGACRDRADACVTSVRGCHRRSSRRCPSGP